MSYGGFDGRAIDAHGGGIANAPDLTRFLNAVGGSRGPQLLTAATLKTMLAKPNNPFWASKPNWYALGWDVNPPKKVVMSHAGAITFGTLSCIFRLHDGITFAALLNHLAPRTSK